MGTEKVGFAMVTVNPDPSCSTDTVTTTFNNDNNNKNNNINNNDNNNNINNNDGISVAMCWMPSRYPSLIQYGFVFGFLIFRYILGVCLVRCCYNCYNIFARLCNNNNNGRVNSSIYNLAILTCILL